MSASEESTSSSSFQGIKFKKKSCKALRRRKVSSDESDNEDAPAVTYVG